MKATRRSFLAALASIPFLRRFVPAPGPVIRFQPLKAAWVGGPVSLRNLVDDGVEAQALFNAIRYDGPEVFYKGLSLTERMKKAREYDQGDQWDAR